MLFWFLSPLSLFDDWQINSLLKTGLREELTSFTPTLFSLTVCGSSQQTHYHPPSSTTTVHTKREDGRNKHWRPWTLLAVMCVRENVYLHPLLEIFCVCANKTFSGCCFRRKVTRLPMAWRIYFFSRQEHLLPLSLFFLYSVLDTVLSCCLAPQAMKRRVALMCWW